MYPSIAADEGAADEAEAGAEVPDARETDDEANEAGLDVLPELAEPEEAGLDVLAELADADEAGLDVLAEPEPVEETLTPRAQEPPHMIDLSPVQAEAHLLSAIRREPGLRATAQ